MTVFDGALIAAGAFLTAGGAIAEGVARWSGASWQPHGSGVGPRVYALTVFDVGVTGQLIAGGALSRAGDNVAEAWARWGPICAPGDVDEDGVVGTADLLALIDAWGPCAEPCPPFCPADLDRDCAVGIVDFLLLLANWTT